jgi:peptide/nickel transport system permease protein
MLQFIISFSLHWLPLEGRFDVNLSLLPGNKIFNYTGFRLVDTLLNGNFNMFGDAVLHIILPAITLSFGTIAIITRIMRSSMLEVMNLDYVRTARSKGLPERLVIRKHARRNALIPTTTVIGLSFGGLLSGAVLTESIFNWPGLGRWSASATLNNDWNGILGFTLLAAFIYVIVNLVVDVLYAYLDPRVRLE